MAAQKKKSGGGVKVAAALGAFLAIAGSHSHGHGILATLTSIPVSGGLNSPRGFAKALIKAEGAPVTSCNMGAVTTWERYEGGGFGNQASFNPLNVNPGAGAGWPGYPATGAWAFPDAPTGFRYTVKTLNNGNYGGIISALQAGGNAQGVCNAIEDSPWAASHYGFGLNCSC